MNYAQKSTHMQKGFTLIEILIAAALVMILGGIVTYSMQGILEKNRKNATRTSLKTVKNAIETYHDELGEYPQTLQDLVQRPSDEKVAANWTKFFDKVPKDGWGKDFVYQVTEGGENPFELYSFGSKKGKSTPKSEWIDAWKL